ncbi:MAG: heme ABC transporter ATP-binding protein [Hyphomicrobiaceae bacterium]
MLEARDLTYITGGSTLLRGVDVGVRPGRIVVLIGPNGAGKSTLLRVLSGDLKPTQGQVLLDGRPLGAFPPSELARRRAVVPQSSALSFPFTALEVTMLGVTVPGFGLSDAEARKAALDALASLDMADLQGRSYVHLSGGERQRVHIARALCQLAMPAWRSGQTRCFLLDEPTASLDLAHQTQVLAALRRQAEAGHAVLAVLHDLNLAAALADDIVLLARTQVVAAGSARQVLRDDLLSDAYGCPVHTNQTPQGDRPFVLPPAIFATEATRATRSLPNGGGAHVLAN